MTSVGRNLLPMEGGGPYVFKVHGSLSHRAGSLLPAPNQPPVYAQLYIYDPDDALTYRMDNLSTQCQPGQDHYDRPSRYAAPPPPWGRFVQISNGDDQRHAFQASVQNRSWL